MQTTFSSGSESSTVNIIEDVNMDIKMNNFTGSFAQAPVQQILISTSDVQMKLSDHQYHLLINLLRAFGTPDITDVDENIESYADVTTYGAYIVSPCLVIYVS